MEGSLVAYKVFTNGSVLQASEINDNLMKQAVAVFSNAAARTAAISSPVEGQVTYLEDVNRYDHWNGSSWVSPFGLTLINSTAFTAQTTITINNVFSAAYDTYLIEFIAVQNTAAGANTFTLVNGGTPAASNWQHNGHIIAAGVQYLNQASSQASALYQVDANADQQFRASIKLVNPFLTTPTQTTRDSYCRSSGFGGNDSRWFQGVLNNTTSYEGIRFSTSAGTVTGTVRIYGLRNA
jgi:hypothetical protein